MKSKHATIGALLAGVLLIDDRAEAKDAAKEHPEIVERLSKLALDWKATLPEKPNPDCISKQSQPPATK